MSVAERLRIPVERIEQVSLLRTHFLAEPRKLFAEAFRIAEQNPEEGQLLLAAAILSQAEKTAEGRLSGALSMISSLVAHADPLKTLGPEGATLRTELLPSGWESMTLSWMQTRYAWREGLETLLDTTPSEAAVVQALNEITRLHPAEREPVSVHIQESFPAPKVAFAITVLGMAFTLRTVFKEVKSRR